ncbi:hypothetical protein MKK70_00950 [Methylobacterium sp. E-041]|uniref:hypothetical protein n=1 Tax=unclassified Methylobacterium TaxID=2615210 RepID=UPI001FBB9C19|nr:MULTISPECIES: hypothetical protein [unclassified Methylobacterium]MCJ2008750.1 hypothetical protein [Methylobacterium sp. J-092]MCJ2103974.1 hypothetical protein [Methylobacterium sp. E-041]
MPTALPLTTDRRLTLRQTSRLACLMLLERYLARRMHWAMLRQTRIGVAAGGGGLLYFTRRWLACHAEIAALLGGPERGDVAEARAILVGCRCQ